MKLNSKQRYQLANHLATVYPGGTIHFKHGELVGLADLAGEQMGFEVTPASFKHAAAVADIEVLHSGPLDLADDALAHQINELSLRVDQLFDSFDELRARLDAEVAARHNLAPPEEQA